MSLQNFAYFAMVTKSNKKHVNFKSNFSMYLLLYTLTTHCTRAIYLTRPVETETDILTEQNKKEKSILDLSLERPISIESLLTFATREETKCLCILSSFFAHLAENLASLNFLSPGF